MILSTSLKSLLGDTMYRLADKTPLLRRREQNRLVFGLEIELARNSHHYLVGRCNDIISTGSKA
jgi:hypothetical protein